MNKKIITFILSIVYFMVTNAFALKIPTGDNVPVTDIKEDGDYIAEVILSEDSPSEITTPIGKLKARAGSTLYFYKSGALKMISFPSNGQEIITPIGKISVYNSYSSSFCEFYESGSPKKLYISTPALLKIGSHNYAARNILLFHDSGSKDKFFVSSIESSGYKLDGEKINSITYTNKSGIFDIRLYDVDIEFHKNGSIKTARLIKAPEKPAMINGNEVFIKGNSSISFYEDGSIEKFIPAELLLTNQNNIKLNIPGGNTLELWETGNIKKCSISNTLTYKTKTYTTTKVLFNKDGTLYGFQTGYDNNTYADFFYDDGSIKRTIKFDEDKDAYYISCFYNPVGYETRLSYDHCFSLQSYSSYYFQNNDYGDNVIMIDYDAKGDPLTYSIARKDKNGNVLLNDFGIPVQDETKKQLIFVEN